MTLNSSDLWLCFAVRYSSLPLAIYREIAAHLESLPGVVATLEWNTDPHFHYLDSQIASLTVQQSSVQTQSRVRQILDHYGLWQQSPVISPADPLNAIDDQP